MVVAVEPGTRRTGVFLVDDQADVRRGLRMVLELEDDLEVVGEAGDGDVLERVLALEPDVILMDVSMPGVGGMEALTVLCERIPCVAVVMHSLYDDDATRERARRLGAAGFVSKNQPEGELVAAIRSAAGWGKGATDA